MQYVKDIEVEYNVDVLVVGGGPSGVAAAWSAAQKGCKVMIVENSGCFGGMGTIGKVPMFCLFTDGINFLAGGFGKLIHEKCFEYGAVSPDDPKIHEKKQGSISINAEKLKRIYDNIVLESGIETLFYTKLIDSIVTGNDIDCVVCSGKSHLFAIKSKIYIDCTGDGILSYYSGATYEKGDENGNLQAGTLCTVWADIDWATANEKASDGLWPRQDHKIEEAYKDGVFKILDKHLPGIWRTGDTIGGGNVGHAFGVDGTDEISLTNASFEQRQRLAEYEKYYRSYVEGFENATVIDNGEIMGIRETRRIVCDYKMTVKDYFDRAVFQDEIGRYAYSIDIHASTSAEHEKYEKLFFTSGLDRGESYGIPYRALIPVGLNNLLVAGRCISCDRYMQASVRVMPGCFITGQAAGMAAAIACKSGSDTRSTNIKEIQNCLKSIGGYLPNFK